MSNLLQCPFCESKKVSYGLDLYKNQTLGISFSCYSCQRIYKDENNSMKFSEVYPQDMFPKYK